MCLVCREVDSDGDEVDQLPPDDPLQGYRVWYSVDVDVEPPPPQTTLAITCNCQVHLYFCKTSTSTQQYYNMSLL